MRIIEPYLAYIKWGAILIVLAYAISWVYGKGYAAAELKHLKATQSLIDGEVKHRVAADKKLAEALRKIPQTGASVAKAVHDHPTSPDCRVPDAAADALQDGIRASQASATD